MAKYAVVVRSPHAGQAVLTYGPFNRDQEAVGAALKIKKGYQLEGDFETSVLVTTLISPEED